MTVATFTGNFVKPTEVFALQHLDATELNRLAPDVLLWMLVFLGIFFAIHFVVQLLSALGQKGKPK